MILLATSFLGTSVVSAAEITQEMLDMRDEWISNVEMVDGVPKSSFALYLEVTGTTLGLSPDIVASLSETQPGADSFERFVIETPSFVKEVGELYDPYAIKEAVIEATTGQVSVQDDAAYTFDELVEGDVTQGESPSETEYQNENTSVAGGSDADIDFEVVIPQMRGEVERLLEKVRLLTRQLTIIEEGGVQTQSAFREDLELGDASIDVLQLQLRLNELPETQVAQTGPGSPGEETDYYGALTAGAVSRYQEYYSGEILEPLGMTEGTGYFGEATREHMDKVIESTGVLNGESGLSEEGVDIPDVYNAQVLKATFQCIDGEDNDNDGLIDYPNDPDCEYAVDDSEGEN